MQSNLKEYENDTYEKERKIIELEKKVREYENVLYETRLYLQHLWSGHAYRNDELVDENKGLLEYIELLENNYMKDNAEEVKYHKTTKFFATTSLFLTISLIGLLYYKI